jgi:hypothetical protein
MGSLTKALLPHSRITKLRFSDFSSPHFVGAGLSCVEFTGDLAVAEWSINVIPSFGLIGNDCYRSGAFVSECGSGGLHV